MKRIKLIGRFLLEVIVFSTAFFWAPVWIQCIIGVVLSICLEGYLARQQKRKLRSTIENIDFSKFKKTVNQ